MEAETGFQSWADITLLPYDDFFKVQLRIAAGVAEKLKKRLTGEEEEVLATPESRSVEAYDFYLQGAYFLLEDTQEATDVAFQFFTKAAELDPALAEAHVGLGAAYYNRYFNGWSGLETLDQAQVSFETALRLKPASMRARRGLIHVFWERGATEACLIQGREAARLGHPSDVESLLTQGWAYLFGGLRDRGIPLLRKVIELDPVNESAHWGLVVFSLKTAEGAEEGIQAAETYFNRFGDNQTVHSWVGVSYQLRADLARAQEHYLKASQLVSTTSSSADSPGSHQKLVGFLFSGLIYERLGDDARAEQTWRRGVELLTPRLEAYPDNVKMRLFLACFYGVLGEKAAFSAEEKRALSTKLNPWEFYYLAAVLAKLGETERSSEILLRTVQQGRIGPDFEWFFETIASVPAPRSDALNELLKTEKRRLRDMY